jgi:hypothetical protein
MRRTLPALALILCLCSPALAAEPELPKDAPALADVQEYVRLFGYREMLEQSANRQLGAIIESVRRERPDVPAQTFDIIRLEMLGEIKVASERAAREMAEAFQRTFSREDVEFLIKVGRDPHMQRVIRLQPKIAQELEGVGDRLAEEVTERAAPRIAQRLNAGKSGEKM